MSQLVFLQVTILAKSLTTLITLKLLLTSVIVSVSLQVVRIQISDVFVELNKFQQILAENTSCRECHQNLIQVSKLTTFRIFSPCGTSRKWI